MRSHDEYRLRRSGSIRNMEREATQGENRAVAGSSRALVGEIETFWKAGMMPDQRPQLDIFIGTFGSAMTVRRRSRERPGAIFACAQSGAIGIDDLVVFLKSDARRLLIALLALRGGLLTKDDAWLLLRGDRLDAGPEDYSSSLHVLMTQARDAAAALGLRIESVWGQGWRAVRAVSQEPSKAGADRRSAA